MSEKETGLIERLARECGSLWYSGAAGTPAGWIFHHDELLAFAAALRAEWEKEGEASLWRWQDDEHCHHFTLNPDKAPSYATAYYTRPQTDDANDAARYRWLRTWVGDFDGLAALNIAEPTTPEELDAAIDAAMSAERKE